MSDNGTEGLEPSDDSSTDHEQQREIGIPRRGFLGAAAGLAALPAAASAEPAEASGVIEDVSTCYDGTYTAADCGSVQGSLNNVHIGADMNDGPLTVKGIHEEGGWSGVGLRWTSGPIEVGTNLDPEDARDLADRLRVAADVAEGKVEGEGGR